MTPKQYKQMMDYLTRKGIKKPFTPASAIERPKKVLEIEAFQDFNKRNPKADGGRIPFNKGGDFEIALENLIKNKDTNFNTIQQIFDKTNTPRTGVFEKIFNKYRNKFKIKNTSALSFGNKQNIHTPKTFQKLLSATGQKEQPEAYKAIIDAFKKAGIEYTPPKSTGGIATFNNVTKETIDIFNKEATKLRAEANLPMSRYQTKQLKKDIKIFVKDKLAKKEYVSRPIIKEHFGLGDKSGDMLITRSLGVNEKAGTGLLKNLGKEEKIATAIANAAKATAAIMETKKDVLKIINDEFKLDPDLSNSEDLAKTIYGDQFPKGNINDLSIEDLRKAESLVRQTDNDVMTYLKVIKGLRDKPDGMRLPTQNVINDITDNILSGIEDESGDGQSFRKKGFRFSSGLLRDYKIAIINQNLGLDPGTYKSERDKLVLKNKNLDEIFSLSALADIAPGYTTKVQSIKKLINMRKASEIDKPFQTIINALNEGKTSMQFKGEIVPIEDAIKDFNKTSLEFSKREKVQSPKINYNVKFDESILDSYGKASQENIKKVYKDKKFFLSDIDPKIKTEDILTSNKKISANLRKLGFKCKFAKLKADGGRIGLSTGSGRCDDPMSYVDDIKKQEDLLKVQKTNSPNAVKTLNTARKLNAARSLFTQTLGAGALAFEAVAALPIAYMGYKGGKTPANILADTTYGLLGKSDQRILLDKAIELGYDTSNIKNVQDFYKKAEEFEKQDARANEFMGPDDMFMYPQMVQKAEKDLFSATEKFFTPTGEQIPEKIEAFNQLPLVEQAVAKDQADLAAERQEKVGGFLQSPVADYLPSLAGGGIAKLAGVDQGPPPVSGPNPQGLLSLKNRVRNL